MDLTPQSTLRSVSPTLATLDVRNEDVPEEDTVIAAEGNAAPLSLDIPRPDTVEEEMDAPENQPEERWPQQNESSASPWSVIIRRSENRHKRFLRKEERIVQNAPICSNLAIIDTPRASVISPGYVKKCEAIGPEEITAKCDLDEAEIANCQDNDVAFVSKIEETPSSSHHVDITGNNQLNEPCENQPEISLPIDEEGDNSASCRRPDEEDAISGDETEEEVYDEEKIQWNEKGGNSLCTCDGGLCKATSKFCDHLQHHLEIAREFDETPPFDIETGDGSPSSSVSGSPRPDWQGEGCSNRRKRKLSDSEPQDCIDCYSKKPHPDSERDKTDGRVCTKALHKERPPPHVQTWLQDISTWPKAEQNLGLERLLATICDSHQLRLVRQLIEPHFQRDFISLLPKELALYVLSFLEPVDLVRAAQTCSTWRFLAEDSLLWREKCREAGIKVISRRSKCNSWKATFMRQHRIEWNWRTRTDKAMQHLRGHDDHVITCLQFAYNRIVSGSDDNTLKVWDATTGECLRTLVGHTGGVWSSQMNETLIISGSTDRTLKVWDADSGKCLHTLYGHTSTVRCMHLHNQKVVSGSRDATLRVWDVSTGVCLYVLVGHLAAVRCVQYDGKLVVSGAYDYTVKVWNPEREECLHTLQGHTNRVYSLQFDGMHVVSGSLDTSIRVWDVETGALKHTLMGHQSLTSGMELRDNILVSGNADSTVKVWDIITGQCLQTLSGPNKHQSAVTCLQFNRRFVITSSDDGTVKLWDVRTGDFIRNLVTLYSGGSGGVVWRIRANDTKLVCAVGSRNGTEETKLVVLDFDVDRPS